MKKGHSTLLIILAVLTFLVTMIGATFAYFTARISGDENVKPVIIKSSSFGTISYLNGNELKLENAFPGATASIRFTISSNADSTQPVKYSLNWSEINNTFDVKEDVVYKLTGTTNGTGNLIEDKNDVVLPSNDGEMLIGLGEVNPGETQEYTLQILFKETGGNQDTNQGKNFIGKIIVDTAN